jgi:4-amino-4-deoxy-L-arabinose transferase-like glycosyltransferase
VREGLQRAARSGAGAIATRRGTIIALLVLAIATRLIALAADPGYVPRNDAYDFSRHAESIAAGDGYPQAIYSGGGGDSAFRPPGYPFFLAGIYAIAGGGRADPSPLPPFGPSADPYRTHWAVGRLANVALGALAVLLVYLIAERIWGRRTGLVAGAIAALFPPMVLLSTELMSESLFVALVLGGVLAALVFRDRRSMRWAALAGLLAGLAALTKANGLVLIPLVMAGVWVVRPRLSSRALAAPALALLVGALTIAPWTVRNYIVAGRFIPVTDQLGFSLAGTYNQASFDDKPDHAPWQVPAAVQPYSRLFIPSVDEGTLDVVLRRQALDFARDHPGYVADATFWNTLRTFYLADPGVYANGEPVTERGVGVSRGALEPIGLFLVLALAVLGAIVLVRRLALPIGSADGAPTPPSRGPLFLWLTPVLLVASALPIIGLPRYRAPMDPFLVMLGALGAIYLWGVLAPRLAAVTGIRAGGAQ